MIRFTLSLLFALALPACTTTWQDAPIVDGAAALPQGSVVPLGQPVALGAVVLTPMRVVEDSRCPINARCIWAGRVIVETRVDGAGWRETTELELGKAKVVRCYRLALTSAEPGRTSDAPTDPDAYRFTYDGGPTGITGG